MAKKKFEAKHFGSILDYVYWRGDIPLANDPWNEVDSLILATIAYENFGENELHIRRSAPLSLRYFWESTDQKRSSLVFKNEFSELRAHLMEALANSIRFRDVLVLDQVNDVDEGRNIQFSAATFSVPGVGIMVSYRGTDSSLVGWKEDCMLSYDTPVPAQLSAIQYLNHIAAAIPGDLYLSGHSKGGNLAVYAASLAPASVQARIRSVCSFDGPGLDSDTIYSDGYSRIKDRLFSVVPSESIVGLLLNYYPNYRVVEATESSIWQHMPFTWKILGKEFLFVDTVSRGAQVLDHSLHEWMKTLSSAQREAVVNTLFCVLGNARNRDNNPAKLSDALATAGLDESSVRMMLSVFYRLMTIHIGNSFGEKIRKPLAMLAGELRMKNLAGHTPVLSSAQIDIDNRGHGFRDIMQEVSNFAEFTGLNHRNAMHLQLLTEEMLTMVRSITGEWNAAFRILCEGNQFQLLLTTRTLLDQQKRSLLRLPKYSETDEESFQTILQRDFANAMLSLQENTEELSYSTLKNTSGGELSEKWARFERSVLLRLADNIKIAIHGGVVFLTVTKSFDMTNMKSAVILIDDSGKGFSEALEETRLMAEINRLSKEDALHLRLFAEEMLNMLRSITGGLNASFWVERDGNRYDLLLTAKTFMSRKKRDLLIASSSSGKNEASKGFFNSLRDVFEQAMVTKRDAAGVLFEKSRFASTDQWDGFEKSVLLNLADNVKIAIVGDEVKMTVSKTLSSSTHA